MNAGAGQTTLMRGTIITMCDDLPFLHDGMIVIEDGKIVHVGPADPERAVGEVIDCSELIVLPGFINTHTHTHSPLLRGVADDQTLMDWLTKSMWPAEKHITATHARNGALLSCLELIESGVTTYADQYYFSEEVAQAAVESGQRALVAPTVFSRPTPESDDPIGVARRFIERHLGDDSRIEPCIGPHAIYSCSTETLQAVRDIALEYDVLVHIHLSETQQENDDCMRQHGVSPTRYLEQIGLLDARVLAAHCVHISEDDRQILARHNVKVSHNPISNFKLVSGWFDYPAFRRHGLDVSVALDGVQSNNSFNLLADLKTGILVQKTLHNDPTLLDAYEALKLITIDAARCLFREHELGSLEVGKCADLTFLDLSRAAMHPLHRNSFRQVVSAVVYAANGADVSDVMVQGEFIYRHRRHVRLDRSTVIANAAESSRQILEHIDFFSR